MAEQNKRRYTNLKEIGPIIEEMFSQGKTKSEIARELGLPGKETVKGYLKRRRKAKNQATHCQKGRSRKRPLTEMEALKKENKHLQMEVELLRSFIQEVERR
jgi:transposase-like protein